jgi:hypothetical protein
MPEKDKFYFYLSIHLFLDGIIKKEKEILLRMPEKDKFYF